jgi:phosphate transport system substrate-binding protein
MASWFSRRRFLTTLGVSAALATRPAHALEAPLRLGGTGAGLGVLKRLGALYMERHPGRTVTVLPSTGSSGGIRAVADGALHAALSGRSLTPDEQQLGVEAWPVLRTPVGFITSHPSVQNVTRDDLVKIYANQIQAWPDGMPVRIILRPPHESVFIAISEYHPEISAAFDAARRRTEILVANTDQENVVLAAHTQGSLAISMLVQIMTEDVKVRMLSLDGVAPSIENLASGRYPSSRDLHLVVRRGVTGPAPELAAFLRSEVAADILKQLGSLSLTISG